MIVPGSHKVKDQAIEEGLDKIFTLLAPTGANPGARCVSR